MNPVGKPKHVKLWKNSPNVEKKHKFSNVKPGFNKGQNKTEESTETIQMSEFNNSKVENKTFQQKFKKPKKKKFGADNFEQKEKQSFVKGEGDSNKNVTQKRKNNFKVENKNFQPKFKKPKKEKFDTGNFKQEKQNFAKSEESSNNNVTQKRKNDDLEETMPNKKVKLCEMKKKERKLVRKQKDKTFEIGKKLKSLWEELRQDSCKPERKSGLLKQVCDLLKGRVKEFTFAHDTVRVLECVLALGAETQRSFLFEELKNDIIPLAKSKYGKFFLLKMLRYGTKHHKDTIMKAFHGKVVSLIRHKEAAEVVEFAFNECANAVQRYELVQEFYGATYKFFKSAEVHSLGQLFEKNPENKSQIIKSMKEELMKVLEKSVVKHSIVHYVLLQFILHCDPTSRSEIIESLRTVVPEILHTKDGSRVSMHCIWYGTIKDRKAIIKSMKTFVAKIAMEEHGHMVLLALFDCVDDTKLVQKHIISELVKNLLELSQNVHGKKVLVYLLNPRDPHFCHPDIIDILKTGDGNETSKKDANVRITELKTAIAQPLLHLIISNIQTLYKDNGFCLFTFMILKHTVGDRTEAYRSIADLAVEPYTTENRNIHVIEHPGSSFMLKQLIIQDKNEYQKEKSSNTATFSEVLVQTVPNLVLKSWMECNRGAFLLVSLLETEIPTVVERIKRELDGCKKYLAKKTYKGAEILLKKLKQ